LTAPALDYPAALRALQSRGRFGINLGLSRTQALLAGLDQPERSFRGALVAGTNGKGSVLALLTSALAAAGYRVGHTPKPHLVTYRERLQIGGSPITPDKFAEIATRVLALADRVAERHGQPTEFELLTAMTFLWFAESRIDVAVVEVGLGGRLDATHAWDGGVAVVTNVTLDHMDRLGSTVEAIAREKAAIVMRGDLAVTGAWGSALDVVERRCRSVAAPLTVTSPAALLDQDRDGIEVELGRLGRTRVGLRGSHQAGNAAVADAALDALEEAGIARVPDDARRAGYATVHWPGRMELIELEGRGIPSRGRPPESGAASGNVSVSGWSPESGGAPGDAGGTLSGSGRGLGRPPESGGANGTGRRREILLDGAHNPAGASALAHALDELAPYLAEGRPTLVLAIMSDKDVDGVVSALSGSALLRDARVICTAPQGGRALPAVALAARWQALSGRAAAAITEPATALQAALASGSGPVVVAGSLYLVGAVRAILVDDPMLEPDPPMPADPDQAPQP
jgi:dihydrofolate synthase/folylpolyglutamate synthase